MTLSKASPRQLIHTRSIACHGYQRQDGRWDIEATLTDTKSYSFANRDRDGIAAGEPIHLMRIRLTLDDDLVVLAAGPRRTPARSRSAAISRPSFPPCSACRLAPVGAEP